MRIYIHFNGAREGGFKEGVNKDVWKIWTLCIPCLPSAHFDSPRTPDVASMRYQVKSPNSTQKASIGAWGVGHEEA